MDASPRCELYPDIDPYRTGRLTVSDTHELYFEESGNPKGKPVVFLHGGPGGGTNPGQRRFFDPAAYRIVLFDQRGCGQSTPHASLEDNTTWHLVEDMEKLRVHLSIETWQVFGGSWGSTLALAYAETHPDRESERVVRGIFLIRRKELHWLYQEGASAVFPDLWQDFLAPIPEPERGDMLSAYYRRLTRDDPEVRRSAAKAWSIWEGSTASLLPDEERVQHFAEDDFADAIARIECHYFVNRGFFDSDDHLLRHAGRIQDIPGVIVQGRYDMLTPVITAWDLHQAWPKADFRLVLDAGHAQTEPGIVHELISATDRFRGS